MIRDFWTEFRWFWCGAFLLAAQKICPRNETPGFIVVQKIREALNAVPGD